MVKKVSVEDFSFFKKNSICRSSVNKHASRICNILKLWLKSCQVSDLINFGLSLQYVIVMFPYLFYFQTRGCLA